MKVIMAQAVLEDGALATRLFHPNVRPSFIHERMSDWFPGLEYYVVPGELVHVENETQTVMKPTEALQEKLYFWLREKANPAVLAHLQAEEEVAQGEP